MARIPLFQIKERAAKAADRKYAEALRESDRACRPLDRGGPVSDVVIDACVAASDAASRAKYEAHAARSELLRVRHAAAKHRKWRF